MTSNTEYFMEDETPYGSTCHLRAAANQGVRVAMQPAITAAITQVARTPPILLPIYPQ